MRDTEDKGLPAEAEEIFQPVREVMPKPITGKKMTARNMHLFTEKKIRVRQERFMQAIRAGASVPRACSIARITPAVYQKWMEDASFKTWFSWSKEALVGYLEEQALKMAEKNPTVLIELLRANKPEKYARGSGGSGDSAINVVINANFGRPQESVKEIEVKVSDGEDD